MSSINIEPPVSTPAHEWAADATNALHSTSVVQGNDFGPTSEASTPGVEFPGSFPRESRPSAQAPSLSEERTPHAAATKLADAAPTKSATDIQASARGYLPNVDVQQVVDAARAYFPESVVGAVGSVLPASMTNANQTEKNLDPTLGAKPASTRVDSLDNISTTAMPPSSERASVLSDTASTNKEGPNVEAVNNLDMTSTAKPNATVTASQDTSSKDASSPINSGNTAVAMHALPTPPSSKDTSPAQSDVTPSQPPGLNDNTTGSKPQNDSSKDSTQPSLLGGSHFVETDGPKVPPKDKDQQKDKDQPTVNTTPTQDYVKSGTAVGARFPGTAAAQDMSAHTSISPTSELSNPHVRDQSDDNVVHTTKSGSGESVGIVNTSDEDADGGKKEGRVKRVMHKVKDKITHRGH